MRHKFNHSLFYGIQVLQKNVIPKYEPIYFILSSYVNRQKITLYTKPYELLLLRANEILYIRLGNIRVRNRQTDRLLLIK